jgi:hypothetical protein
MCFRSPRSARPPHFVPARLDLSILDANREERAVTEDTGIHASIEQLVAEEHRLWELESRGESTDSDRRRLDTVKVSLDQCWDLLRQRRALREANQDPDAARVREPEVVERYEQ